MSKKYKNKLILSIVIAIASLILFGLFLLKMQTNLSVNSQQKDTKLKLQQMETLLEDADEAEKQTIESYDDVFIAKVESLAYMAKKEPDFTFTDVNMQGMKELMEVTNILVLDKQGNMIAKAEDTAADFTYNRYNQLRTVYKTGKASEPFEVKVGDVNRRYYGSAIDAESMVVIEQDSEELDTLISDDSTWKNILGNVSVGLDGYAFAISARDYTFLYHPNDQLIGQDALSAGIDTVDLEDNHYAWMKVKGERLYCGVSKTEEAYIICAVTEEEINASRNMTVIFVLFIFFAVLTLVILYAALTIKTEARTAQKSGRYKAFGGLYFDKVVGQKIGTVAVAGLIGILCMSFYMQTLFSLSRQSMSNEQHVKEVQKTIDQGKKNIETLTEQYNERYLNKCRIIAHLLSQSSELKTKEELKALSSILGVQFINVFDTNGEKIATNSMYTKFQISQDPKDQSYEFNRLLEGADYVIQEAQNDETSGEYRQFMGVALRDGKGDANGFIQVAIRPSKLEDALKNNTISYVLKSVRVGADGFAFAVNKEDKTFAYYPNERMTGRKAVNYGMKKSQFRDEYSDYIKIGSNKYYGSSLETDDYYIYVVVPVSEMTNNRGTIAAISALASLICLAIIYVLLTFGKKEDNKGAVSAKRNTDGPMIDVVMPDGSVRKTEAAASRWSNLSIGWDDKTPEQQIFSVLKGIFAVMALVISLAVIFKDQILHGNSILRYVLDGKWERGLNIFALTASLMIICVVSVFTMILRKVLKLLGRTFGAKGETLCRLLNSFVKYASVIIMLYYCLALVGVDTRTLLASAGILTLVVGLGAQQLVSDILAGLFIIFEGEFQVGDIVTIGDCRGTVIEIGIRTTKIEDGSKDIKVISNSQVSGVINMTKYHSFASADFGIEYGESLERVENILETELPNIKKRLPSIQDGPFYKGVVELGNSSVNLRIVAQCAEADRVQLGRDMNRELKILCDKNDINMPYPQIVINQPAEFESATASERRRADKFHKEQAKLAKDMNEEPVH